MKRLIVVLLLVLAGCIGANPDSTAIPTNAAPTATKATEVPREPTITPTRDVASIDCQSNAVRDGFWPINNNPCLRGGEILDVNPPSITNSNRDRVQWIPAGFQPYWQRGTVIDPYVFRVDGGGFRVDIDYQDGGYGVGWFQEFPNVGSCYVLKLTVHYNIQPRQNAPLSQIQFMGRMVSLSQGITRLLTPQSPSRASGTQEFIWPILSPAAAHVDLYQVIQWASYDGEIDWKQIEMLDPPAGTNYCGEGTVTF